MLVISRKVVKWDIFSLTFYKILTFCIIWKKIVFLWHSFEKDRDRRSKDRRSLMLCKLHTLNLITLYPCRMDGVDGIKVSDVLEDWFSHWLPIFWYWFFDKTIAVLGAKINSKSSKVKPVRKSALKAIRNPDSMHGSDLRFRECSPFELQKGLQKSSNLFFPSL